MRRLLPVVCALFCAAPARAANYAASAGVERASVEGTVEINSKVKALSGEAKALKKSAEDNLIYEDDVHGRARSFFDESIPQEDALRIGALDLRGWAKPDRSTSMDINGILTGMERGIRKGFKDSPVPPPSDLMAARDHAFSMRSLTNYGGLDPAVMGVYVYRPDSPIGIFFNGLMQMVQGFLGDEFAAATAVHEAAHARDHALRRLNPRYVRNGETWAFKSEYAYLMAIDPTGEKLSWARATFGKFAKGAAKAPDFVGEYLEHLARIRLFGDQGDWMGLVASLGYQDDHSHNYAERMGQDGHAHGERLGGSSSLSDHHPGDGHDHGPLPGLDGVYQDANRF